MPGSGSRPHSDCSVGILSLKLCRPGRRGNSWAETAYQRHAVVLAFAVSVQ